MEKFKNSDKKTTNKYFFYKYQFKTNKLIDALDLYIKISNNLVYNIINSLNFYKFPFNQDKLFIKELLSKDNNEQIKKLNDELLSNQQTITKLRNMFIMTKLEMTKKLSEKKCSCGCKMCCKKESIMDLLIEDKKSNDLKEKELLKKDMKEDSQEYEEDSELNSSVEEN